MNIDILLNEPYLNYKDFYEACKKLKNSWEKQTKIKTGEEIVSESFVSGLFLRGPARFAHLKKFKDTTKEYTTYSTLLTMVYNNEIRKGRTVPKFNIEEEYDKICDHLLMIEATLCLWIVRHKEEGMNTRLRTPESIERFATLPKSEIIERSKGRIPDNYFSNRNIQVLLEVNRELEHAYKLRMEERKKNKSSEQK